MNAPRSLLSIGLMLTAAAAAPAETSSWVFLPSTYTHDRATGARVAQFQRVAPVQPLPDPRLVVSGYRAQRTTLRDANGAVDTGILVTNFANGRGGLDAEWERVADEWRASFLTGSFFQQSPGAFGPGFGQPGFGQPGFGQPGFGQQGFVQPGLSQPGLVQPGFLQPGFVQPGFVQPGFAPAFFPPGFVGQPGFAIQPGFGPPGFVQPGFHKPAAAP